jgi:hypothetical protein
VGAGAGAGAGAIENPYLDNELIIETKAAEDRIDDIDSFGDFRSGGAQTNSGHEHPINFNEHRRR